MNSSTNRLNGDYHSAKGFIIFTKNTYNKVPFKNKLFVKLPLLSILLPDFSEPLYYKPRYISDWQQDYHAVQIRQSKIQTLKGNLE